MRHAATLIASAALLASTFAAQAQERYFSIASAPTGGVYYPIGGGLSALLSQHMEGVSVAAEATAGSVDNIKLTGGDPTYLGLASADVVADAASGSGSFAGDPQDLRTLLVMYPNIAQVVVTVASGINSIEDMKGKRIGTGTPGSGFELFSTRLMTAAGLDPEADVDRVKLSTSDTFNALRDGKIDGLIFVGGAPAGGLLDLMSAPGLELKFLPVDAYMESMNATYDDLYAAGSIPAETYPGQSGAIQTIGVWNLLMANAALSDADAKVMCEVIFGHIEDVRAVHPALSQLNLEAQQAQNSPVPLHPGAEACVAAQ